MMSLDWGTPGAGKTHNLMKYQVLPALSSGRGVFTNINGLSEPSCLDAISKYTNKSLEEIDHLLTVFPVEGVVYIGNPSLNIRKSIGDNLYELVRLGDDEHEGDLIVLDEASDPELFDAEKRKVNDEMWIFFKKHRHYNVDICLMAHHPRDLIPKISRLCAEYTYYRKLIGVNEKKFRYEKWLAGYSSSSHGTKVKQSTEYYDDKIFKCYKSTVAGDGTNDGNMDSRFSLWGSSAPKLIIGSLLIFFVGGYFFLSSFFGDENVFIKDKNEQSLPTKEPLNIPSSPLQGSSTPTNHTLVTHSPKYKEPSHFDLLFSQNRVIYEGYTIVKGHLNGWVSFWNGDELVQRVSFNELRNLGAKFSIPSYDSSFMPIKYNDLEFIAVTQAPKFQQNEPQQFGQALSGGVEQGLE